MIICTYRKRGEEDGQVHTKECSTASQWQDMLHQQSKGSIKIVSIRKVATDFARERASERK